jgi:NAD(P)-dependent dehydrogenase (short-subunit alcohol dehydrogenase family)
MTHALIVGASRGLGFEFAKQYKEAGHQVTATYRSESDRLKLRELGVQTLKLDVNEEKDITQMAWQLKGDKLDMAIINAGVYGPRNSVAGLAPSQDDFDLVMRTNVLASMRLVPIVAPLLVPARGTLAFLSSRMGSIAEANASFGMLYRTSKAAINMVAKLAHTDFGSQGVRVISLHPGWVRTDMGGPNADVAVQDSVQGMRNVIAQPQAFPSGCFFDYRGQSLAW